MRIETSVREPVRKADGAGRTAAKDASIGEESEK
jgi:hypothetical protein